MFNRFRVSLQLLRNSLAVMTEHPKLAVFPVVIGFITIGLAAFFIGPMLLYPTGHSLLSGEHWQALGRLFFGGVHGPGRNIAFVASKHPFLMGYMALFYLVSMFTATFLNVAFYHEILSALRGGDVSITRGLQFAGQRWKSVLLWALFAGLVTWVLSWLEQKFDLFGKLVMR
ncbi:MAG TPA: DUF6159 family protein, partial [Verrucomicrobiae bacterium]|nr:DUF6159 family protein [Verrucomicrobiae bacterium]